MLVPIAGTALFILLYVIATFLYPGGSQADKNAEGFSWLNNYWCNLLNEYAINGQRNAAQPVALTGMFILCLTLTFFWLSFPLYVFRKKPQQLFIQITGSLSMLITLLLFTGIDHDLVTNFASFFGLLATIGTLIGLYKIRWRGLLLYGIANLLLVVLNNYVYYHKSLLLYLPVIQKISFAFFLAWICSISTMLYCRKGSLQ